MYSRRKSFWLCFLTLVFLASLLFAQDPFSRVSITWPLNGASNSIAWIDYDNDGDLDFFITNGAENNAQVNFLYRNDGNGVFTRITSGSIATEQMVSAGSTWGDYDGDGDLDVYVTTAAYNIPFFGTRNNDLFENNGDGTFTMITSGDAVNEDEFSASCAWIDYDGDGDLDLFVTNGTPRLGASSTLPRVPFLFENDGTGTLTKLPQTAAGDLLSHDTTFAAAHTWGDFDNDGDLDAFVCSGGRKNSTNLYQNNGDGTFTKILASTFHDTVITEGAEFVDYDNDGDLDLFLTNATGDSIGVNNYLYHNNGDGTFTLDTNIIIASDGGPSFGCTFGDFDNDGDLDLYVSNAKQPQWVVYNFLYTNDGPPNYTFTKVTNSIAVTDTNNSRGCAFADYDNDGFLDLMVVHNDQYNENNLYHNELKNQGNTNHYITVVPQATTSNATAIGTRIRVKATIFGYTYWQLREIAPVFGFGSVNLWPHFGLGNATNIDSMTVFWPFSNTTNIFTDVSVDRILTIVEGGSSTTASVRSGQTGEFLFGGTNATLNFTANSDADGGTVTVTRYNTAPTNNSFSGSATAPDGSTVTPDVVAPDRYWSVSSSTLTGVTFTISLDINNLPGVSNPDRLVIVTRPDNTSPWTPLNTTRVGNRLFASGVSAYGEFTIASNSGDNSLPVKLSLFTAIARPGEIELKWITESEINNLGFVLERATSRHGPFQEIASYVYNPDLRGSGNSNFQRTYRYVDHNVMNGVTYYYKLYDVDYDGRKTFLGIVKATPETVPLELKLYPNYPNPFNPSTTIRFDVPESLRESAERITVQIFDGEGRLVRNLIQQEFQAGQFQVQWDGTDDFGRRLPSGIYYGQLRIGPWRQTIKMALIK